MANTHDKSKGKGFDVGRDKKNEFRKDEGLGEFAHACAKFCKRIKHSESIPKK